MADRFVDEVLNAGRVALDRVLQGVAQEGDRDMVKLAAAVEAVIAGSAVIELRPGDWLVLPIAGYPEAAMRRLAQILEREHRVRLLSMEPGTPIQALRFKAAPGADSGNTPKEDDRR